MIAGEEFNNVCFLCTCRSNILHEKKLIATRCAEESFRSRNGSRAICHSVRKTDLMFTRCASPDKNEIKILLINQRDALQASFSKSDRVYLLARIYSRRIREIAGFDTFEKTAAKSRDL